MAFEMYVKSARICQPLASILSRGQIGINKDAVERFKIKDYKFAILFYDKDIACIGIRLTNDKTEKGAMTIIRGKTGVVILAISFLNFYQLDYRDKQKYLIERDEDKNLYVIDLKKRM